MTEVSPQPACRQEDSDRNRHESGFVYSHRSRPPEVVHAKGSCGILARSTPLPAAGSSLTMSTHNRETDPFVLLRTKFQRPRLRPSLVPRPRLLDQLHACLKQSGSFGTLGFARKLILVSAPAGNGKTTALGQWLDDCPHPSA